jgi:hypothetical protein
MNAKATDVEVKKNIGEEERRKNTSGAPFLLGKKTGFSHLS